MSENQKKKTQIASVNLNKIFNLKKNIKNVYKKNVYTKVQNLSDKKEVKED